MATHLLYTTYLKLNITWSSAVPVQSHHARKVSQLQSEECLGPYLYCEKMPEVRKQRSLQAHFIALCIPHTPEKWLLLQQGLSKWSAPQGQHPQQGALGSEPLFALRNFSS